MTGVDKARRLDRLTPTSEPLSWDASELERDVDRLTAMIPHHPAPAGLSDIAHVTWLAGLFDAHAGGCPTGACDE